MATGPSLGLTTLESPLDKNPISSNEIYFIIPEVLSSRMNCHQEGASVFSLVLSKRPILDGPTTPLRTFLRHVWSNRMGQIILPSGALTISGQKPDSNLRQVILKALSNQGVEWLAG